MNNEKIEGIITDGDIRRLIERTTNLEGVKAKDIINSKPKTINSPHILFLKILKFVLKNFIRL